MKHLCYENLTKPNRHDQLFFTLIALSGFFFIACDKEDDEVLLTPYEMLTAHVWVSDSLLADGQYAGGEGELL